MHHHLISDYVKAVRPFGTMSHIKRKNVNPGQSSDLVAEYA
jgi:hypothetical protein